AHAHLRADGRPYEGGRGFTSERGVATSAAASPRARSPAPATAHARRRPARPAPTSRAPEPATPPAAAAPGHLDWRAGRRESRRRPGHGGAPPRNATTVNAAAAAPARRAAPAPTRCSDRAAGTGSDRVPRWRWRRAGWPRPAGWRSGW